MSDLKQQKNQKIELTDNQKSPGLCRPEDLKIGSVSRSEEEHARQLKDSEAVRSVWGTQQNGESAKPNPYPKPIKISKSKSHFDGSR